MSAKVLESSFKTGREIAKITTRDDVVSLKNVPDGTEIVYKGFVKSEIVNENTGEKFDSIVVLAEDGILYGTRSETFMRRLDEILEIVKDDPSDEPIVLRLTHGTSKSGNKFASCSLA